MKRNNKGFTLAELLIVVAIIASLIAIGSFTFLVSMEKAREATDLANLRYAQALMMSACIDNSKIDNSKYEDYSSKDAIVDKVVYSNDGNSIVTVVPITQKQDGWQYVGGDDPAGQFIKGGAVVEANNLGENKYYYLLMSIQGNNIGAIYDSGYTQ